MILLLNVYQMTAAVPLSIHAETGNKLGLAGKAFPSGST